MLRDPSWQHMLRGWLRGVDGGGILFYLTGRLWFRIFGPSVFSVPHVLGYRLCHGSHRNLGGLATFLSTRNRGLCGPGHLVWQPRSRAGVVEGRFMACSWPAMQLAVYLYFRVADSRQLPRRFDLLVFAAHACLGLYDILGVFYSSLIVLAMIILDLSKQRWRPGLYYALRFRRSCSSPVFRLSTHRQRWESRTSGRCSHPWCSFWRNYSGFSFKLGALLLLSVLVLWIGGRKRGRAAGFAPLVLLNAAPSTSIQQSSFFCRYCFSSRESLDLPCVSLGYLLPVTVGTMFVVAETLQLGGSLLEDRGRVGFAFSATVWTVFMAAPLLYDFAYLPRYNSGLQKDYTVELTSQLPKSIPVICGGRFCLHRIGGSTT